MVSKQDKHGKVLAGRGQGKQIGDKWLFYVGKDETRSANERIFERCDATHLPLSEQRKKCHN